MLKCKEKFSCIQKTRLIVVSFHLNNQLKYYNVLDHIYGLLSCLVKCNLLQRGVLFPQGYYVFTPVFIKRYLDFIESIAQNWFFYPWHSISREYCITGFMIRVYGWVCQTWIPFTLEYEQLLYFLIKYLPIAFFQKYRKKLVWLFVVDHLVHQTLNYPPLIDEKFEITPWITFNLI